MMEKLSDTIVNHSLKIKKNEKVLITSESINAKPLILSLIKKINQVGGLCQVKILDSDINSKILEGANKEEIDLISKMNSFEIDLFDAFIKIIYVDNEYNGMNIKKDIRKELDRKNHKSNEIKINEKKWVLLNYPSNTLASKAHMTNSDFNDYIFDVMNVDYDKMAEDIKPLKKLLESTDRVRIVAPDTDLTFSIKDMPIIPCTGECNIPDGEIFTAPIKNSVNGKITYNTPSPYHGNIYNHVSLEFKDGKIVNATCDEEDDKINEIFDTDEGSRYIGEFAIGLNPKILKPVGDILFDEKIIGSIHFTPGMAYKEAYNGNDSDIHWDLVLIEREEYGGGKLYFDDKLVRENGKFVLDELKHLNLK